MLYINENTENTFFNINLINASEIGTYYFSGPPKNTLKIRHWVQLHVALKVFSIL